jgi:hypothetical protein
MSINHLIICILYFFILLFKIYNNNIIYARVTNTDQIDA